MLLDIKKFSVFIYSLLLWIIFIQTSKSQDSESEIVSELTPIIKYSNAKFKNNINYDVIVYGRKNSIETLIDKFGPYEEFTIPTNDYDSLKFYSKFLVNGRSYSVNDFRAVLENEIFKFLPNYIFEPSGFYLIVDNLQLKNLIGERIYDFTITDDVDPSAVDAAALPESSPFIDVIRIDSVTYQVKLKTKEEFLRNLSDKDKQKWSKGAEIEFPIGVVLYDSNVKEHIQPYQLFLKKKKKVKKTSG